MPTPPCDDCDTPFLADVGAFAIDPQQPDILYAGGYGGVSKSTDGGASWKVMNGGLPLPTGNARELHHSDQCRPAPARSPGFDLRIELHRKHSLTPAARVHRAGPCELIAKPHPP